MVGSGDGEGSGVAEGRGVLVGSGSEVGVGVGGVVVSVRLRAAELIGVGTACVGGFADASTVGGAAVGPTSVGTASVERLSPVGVMTGTPVLSAHPAILATMTITGMAKRKMVRTI